MKPREIVAKINNTPNSALKVTVNAVKTWLADPELKYFRRLSDLKIDAIEKIFKEDQS